MTLEASNWWKPCFTNKS